MHHVCENNSATPPLEAANPVRRAIKPLPDLRCFKHVVTHTISIPVIQSLPAFLLSLALLGACATIGLSST